MNLIKRWSLRRTAARGVRLQEAGRFDEALPLLQNAMEPSEGKERAALLSRIGLCELGLGRTAAARTRFEEVLTLATDDAGAWLNFGIVCMRLGDRRAADGALQKALDLEPDRPDVLYHQASLFAEESARAGFEAARNAARITLETLEKPGGVARLVTLGFPPELPMVLLRNLGLDRTPPEEAAAALRELADRKSTPATVWVRPAALNHLGLLLANTGKYDEAVAAYRDAQKADPTIEPVHFNLAMTLARQHAAEEAGAELKLYAERHAGSAVVAYGYATLAEHRGDAQEAVRHYKGALERARQSPPSPAVLARLDISRRWTDYAQRFIEAVSGTPDAPPGEQWTGPTARN